jgi:glycosyltransferase involved in cell wall biosynthesis
VTNKPLVSVVTPVYNGGPYLRECIESVIAQSYSNWEYTIFNNCSSDETASIADEYARRDRRIRVYTGDVFVDCSTSHNRAVRLISPHSTYCKVVSGDDWLFPECLDRLVAVAEANPSVGVVGSYQLFGGSSDWRTWQIMWAELPYPSTVIPGREVCRMQLLGGPFVFGTPTAVLYRADLVRAEESFYPNLTHESDTSACYKQLQHCDFGFVHQVLSYGRIHQRALSTEAKALNAYQPSLLNDLVTYGRSFLSPDELQRRTREVLNDYYHYLAVSAVHRREKSFWQYHKRRLADCGHPFSHVRFSVAVAAKLLDLLLNPKQTVEKALRLLPQ